MSEMNDESNTNPENNKNDDQCLAATEKVLQKGKVILKKRRKPGRGKRRLVTKRYSGTCPNKYRRCTLI